MKEIVRMKGGERERMRKREIKRRIRLLILRRVVFRMVCEIGSK